jgi:C4-dicarboxylate-specific signal transduction histidine kinase
MSIGDSEVDINDHKAIAKDMEEWTKKISEHVEYMSDVITTVKGQAKSFTGREALESFTVEEAIKQIKILMKHELNYNCISLNIKDDLRGEYKIKGNVVSLVQIINNIISNAIQASLNSTKKEIDLGIFIKNKSVIFEVRDYGSGISKEISNKLFSEMVTTKGKNGTGLGLFMSYSKIKAEFNGNIYFETRIGEGTTFFIEVPIK